MDRVPDIQPLPLRSRKLIFWTLLLVFLCALPFLYLSATGYRFELGGGNTIVPTGGMYIASDRTGAEIYIDGELVRETRTFRRAFYAQNIEPGTHRVHVQKEDHHTWVKELPVSPHLVTEAQAFNLPLVPQLRVVSRWQTATGSQVIREQILFSSTTNETFATGTSETNKFIKNTEYESLLRLFITPTTTVSSTTESARTSPGLISTTTGTTTAPEVAYATTTKEFGGARLFEENGAIFARWIGPRIQMPYYYCAEPFPAYSTSTDEFNDRELSKDVREAQTALILPPSRQGATAPLQLEYSHPLETQYIPDDAPCDPVIQIDRKSQQVTRFDFMPGGSDFVVLALDDGVYVTEIDDRSWQNMQPLLRGKGLDFRIHNGLIFLYDGSVIYQIFPKY